MSTSMEEYGMAYTSPGLCSPGLLGTQGWSPSSSVYSDYCDEMDSTIDERSQRRSVQFPLPPLRTKNTRPLTVLKPRAVSAKVQAHHTVMNGWEFSSGEEDEFGNGFELDGFGIITHSSTAPSMSAKTKKRPMNLQLPTYNRRVFSAPAPPAYSDIQDGEEVGEEEEPDEYPFPIMSSYRSEATNLQEEKEKLRRLQASMALLGVDEMYQERQMKGDDQWALPTHGRSPTSVLSPEHRAPSLAEQMAYASGLGSQCQWSSPHKMVRASSDVYVPRKAEVLGSTYAQEERRMASRHVRQGVAASGSVPMANSLSSPMVLPGEAAEVGSSWSHTAGDDDGEDSEAEEEQYWLRTNTPMGRSFSHHSMAASTVVSVNSSPILHGALSAADFGSHHSSQGSSDSDIDSPSTCATSVQSYQLDQYVKVAKWNHVDVNGLFHQSLAVEEGYESSTSSGSSETVATPNDSPNSLHEFSYILDSEEFSQNVEPSTVAKAAVNVFGNDGFDGNTFSPALKTPELGQLPANPLSFAASPFLDQGSIEPHSTVLPKEEENVMLGSMPKSVSTTSMLERPRPFSRSETASFFAGVPAIHKRSQLSTSASEAVLGSKTFAPKHAREARRPSHASSAMASSGHPDIPNRRSSLEVSTPLSSVSHNSVQAYFEESNQDLLTRGQGKPVPSISFLDTPPSTSRKSALPTSQSEMMHGNRRLSAKALAQVKEACRAKADFVRNTALNKEEMREEAEAEAAAARKREEESLKQMAPRHRPLRQSQSERSNLNAGAYSKRSSANSRSSLLLPSLPSRRSIISLPDSAKVPMPTLYVARSASQRQKGITGVPATEPGLLALAKLGFRTAVPSRYSKVDALKHGPHAMQETDVLNNMPEGVVLIVEEEHITESHVLVA